MVDLMQGRSVDPEVQRLADAIRDAQGPEIETMSDWLTSWGEQVPPTMRDHTNADESGGDMGDMGDMGGSGHGTEDMHGFADMPGMMSAEDMQALQDAPDATFQDMWLQMMIEHHQGAVEMARTEIADGRYKPAIDLAKQIVASQSKEIETMQGILS